MNFKQWPMMIHAGKASVRSRRDKQILANLCCCEIIQSDWSEEFMWLFFYFYQSNYIISAKHNSATPKFVYDIGSWSWSYEQNMSINLCYTHFRALFLVEILEQPIRMLKNEHSVIWRWKYLNRIGPWMHNVLLLCRSCWPCATQLCLAIRWSVWQFFITAQTFQMHNVV